MTCALQKLIKNQKKMIGKLDDSELRSRQNKLQVCDRESRVKEQRGYGQTAPRRVLNEL